MMNGPERGEPHGGAVASNAASWPAWLGAAGLLAAMMTSQLLTAMAAGGFALTDAGPPAFRLAALGLQDGVFVATAATTALLAGPVRGGDFGLRRPALRPAVGWTVAVTAAYLAFLAVYSTVVSPEGRQSTLDALGVHAGRGYLATAAVLVIVAAPFAEEILFRGLMYRSLRNRFGVGLSAAAVGAVFGAVHYQGPKSVGALPLLAALGVAFCVLYERTGSLYPAIMLHAANNAVAFGAGAGESGAPWLAVTALGITLTACLVPATHQARPPSTSPTLRRSRARRERGSPARR